MTRRRVLPPLAAAVVLTLSACGGGDFVYRFDPELGVPYQGATTTRMHTQASMQGMDLELTMALRMEQDVVFEAGAASDPVVGRYTIASMSAEVGGMPGIDQVPFDLNDLYQGMVGETLTVVTDRSGQTVEVSGLEQAIAAMLDRAEVSDQVKQMASQAIESNFGGGQIENLFEQGVPRFPEHPVGTGDTWSQSVEAYGLTVDSNYTLGERIDGVAKVEVAGSVTGVGEAGLGLPEIPGFEMSSDNLSGSFEGAYEVEEATGLGLRYSASVSMETELVMAMPQVQGAPPDAPSITMSLAMEMEVEGELSRAE